MTWRSPLVALLLAGCAPSRAAGDVAQGSGASGVRYLALGDSFTIGTGSTPSQSFPARLVDRWSCHADLLNAGVNGYTTDDLIALELPDVASFSPTFVTVLIGANDIVQGSSADVYRGHVRYIFQALREAAVPRIVALPQPDWSKSPVAAAFGAPETLHRKILLFNRILSEETRAAHGEYVDLFPLMEDQADAKMLAPDGLHPSAAAYDGWAGELAKTAASPCP